MDAERYGPWAFLAGGSEGVGACFARRLAARGISLVVAARKPEPIAVLAAGLRADFGVAVRELPLNLAAPDMLDRVHAATADIAVGFLLCNAGAETSSAGFLARRAGRAETMIALNVTAPAQLAHLFGAGMRERGRGGIVVVGSNSCHTGAPGQVVYAAAKAFQFTFAEGLWAELRPYGVDVLGLILGLTDTPNIRRMGFSLAGHAAADPDDVAREGLEHLGDGPIRVIGGWTDRIAGLRGLPREEAMALAGKAPPR